MKQFSLTTSDLRREHPVYKSKQKLPCQDLTTATGPSQAESTGFPTSGSLLFLLQPPASFLNHPPGNFPTLLIVTSMTHPSPIPAWSTDSLQILNGNLFHFFKKSFNLACWEVLANTFCLSLAAGLFNNHLFSLPPMICHTCCLKSSEIWFLPSSLYWNLIRH